MNRHKFYTYTQISGEESERLLVKLRELTDSGTIDKLLDGLSDMENIVEGSDIIKKLLLLLEYDESNNTITINGGTYIGDSSANDNTDDVYE